MSFIILSTKSIDGVTFQLCSSSKLSHFSPSGKARLKMITTYSVEALKHDVNGEVISTHDSRERFNFTSKLEAAKYFKSLETKSVVIETSGVDALKRLYG